MNCSELPKLSGSPHFISESNFSYICVGRLARICAMLSRKCLPHWSDVWCTGNVMMHIGSVKCIWIKIMKNSILVCYLYQKGNAVELYDPARSYPNVNVSLHSSNVCMSVKGYIYINMDLENRKGRMFVSDLGK